ncbi:MAG TPA: TorF family putative porin [Gammaproteobacteria bacterium]|nr:TorF family putative porin [Gammaproteobacteria bacterium]
MRKSYAKVSKLNAVALAVALGSSAAVVSPAANAGASGNIGLWSKYVLRGITNSPENDNAAVQGGFDWSGDSGVYLGYWGSSLSYADAGKSNGFENDFYGGWAGKAGPLDVSLGAIYYKYINISNADGFEINPTVGYMGVTLGAKYLTKDVTWGNKGDTYWTLSYSHDLPAGFSLSGLLGYYTYKDSGKYISSSKESSAFRDLDLTLSHPIGNSGADMNATYIVGGKDRDGNSQDNTVVFSLTYGFDI